MGPSCLHAHLAQNHAKQMTLCVCLSLIRKPCHLFLSPCPSSSVSLCFALFTFSLLWASGDMECLKKVTAWPPQAALFPAQSTSASLCPSPVLHTWSHCCLLWAVGGHSVSFTVSCVILEERCWLYLSLLPLFSRSPDNVSPASLRIKTTWSSCEA